MNRVENLRSGFWNLQIIPTEGGVIIVDTGTPNSTLKILKELGKRGFEVRDLQLIICTHGHGDHVGSAARLRERTRAPILMHRADAVFVQKGKTAPLVPTNLLTSLFASVIRRTMPMPPPFVPDIILDKETSLKRYGLGGKIIPTPGHTAGSISVILDTGEAIVGDLIIGGLFNQRKPASSYFLEDPEKARQSIQRVLQEGAEIFYSGHGGPFPASDVRRIFRA